MGRNSAPRSREYGPFTAAKRGYEGAVTTDHDQQAQAVSLFLTDALLRI
jgi:hypothetical protein